jgi:SpoVK/Ycf46/Vps4 family AAA+-type ATPase
MYDRRDKDFGNGRDVRKLFEETVRRLSSRVSGQLGKVTDDAALTTIRAEDVAYELRGKQQLSLEDVMGRLDRLIGLSAVKAEVRRIVDYLKVEQARAAAGGKVTPLNLHFVFRGNPGTGKTTVARVLADVFKALGLLSKGHLVEVEKSKLVAQYVGQTAPMTNAVIDSAMGGILFIDEAYSLTPKGAGYDFGQEAIDTLLKRMEDDRGKFIVIAAGYSEEMDRFVSSNPGLVSRFTKHIDFDDYTPDEMKAIFRSMAEAKGMVLGLGVETVLDASFQRLYATRDRSFANGRTVRNLFEAALQNQAGRVASLVSAGNVSADVLTLITADDISSFTAGGRQ